MIIEMDDPINVGIEEIESGFNQRSVAMTYGFAIRQHGEHKYDFAPLNEAIQRRWKGKSALERVKKMAWKFAEGGQI